MDGYQAVTAMIASAWQRFDDPASPARHFCLDAIGDVLERRSLAQQDAERVVERLVQVALCDDEGGWELESALHAVCTAATYYRLPYRLVQPLAVGVDGFEPELLSYVLVVLGFTYDQAALPTVERFLEHPHPEVRGAAADALAELRRCRERGRSGTA
ncbi:HEAT repeat domain-containing protein [Kitasatospora sp. LaBMicrA B282]|uniref:HEAT repeat domain-containing protein n=1 Tax=Kitasatospora sp. LaBMicrA B282 TaxID=3420949 RepID=UPI003D0CC6F3